MVNEVDDRTERTIRARQTARLVFVAVIAAVLVVWAVANDGDVEIDWLVETTTGPLVLVIAASAALGFVLGLLVGWRRRH